MHKVRNVVFNRTSLLTLRNLAVKATFGFLYRLTGREALVYNLKSEVMDAGAGNGDRVRMILQPRQKDAGKAAP